VDRTSADDPSEAAVVAGLLGDGLAARIDRWVADERVDEAARLRARERWLRHQAEEEGTLAGVLADIAERGASVALHVLGGRRHRGEVAALGSDFVAFRSAGADVIVALHAVTSMRTLPGEASTIGDRSVGTSHRLVDVLAGLAAERATVVLVLADHNEAVAGVVLWAGQDVVGVRVAGGTAIMAYVAVGAIVEVVVDG
jgi:hypothetical protein